MMNVVPERVRDAAQVPARAAALLFGVGDAPRHRHHAICRHREWSKFGLYDEATFRRLTDDLC